jgi:hypothetical protein
MQAGGQSATGAALCRLVLSLSVAAVGCATVQPVPNGPTQFHGQALVAGERELDVYYPAPFVSCPHLDARSLSPCCEVLEQHPDHFRIKNPSSSAAEVIWYAQGIQTPDHIQVPSTPGP